MAQQLRALTDLPGDPGLIPSTHIVHNCLLPQDLTLSHRHTCRQNTNARKISESLKKKSHYANMLNNGTCHVSCRIQRDGTGHIAGTV